MRRFAYIIPKKLSGVIMQENKSRGYGLKIDKDIEISGVKKAVECSDRVVRFQLNEGAITIVGQNLDVKKIDMETGVAVLSGEVKSIDFSAFGGLRLAAKLFK